MAVDASPFSLEHAAPLARGKFRDPYRTNGGDERAFVGGVPHHTARRAAYESQWMGPDHQHRIGPFESRLAL